MAAYDGRLEILKKIWECSNKELTTGGLNNKLFFVRL